MNDISYIIHYSFQSLFKFVALARAEHLVWTKSCARYSERDKTNTVGCLPDACSTPLFPFLGVHSKVPAVWTCSQTNSQRTSVSPSTVRSALAQTPCCPLHCGTPAWVLLTLLGIFFPVWSLVTLTSMFSFLFYFQKDSFPPSPRTPVPSIILIWTILP